MKILHLTLKKKWFDMIASGEKKEEYRELKPYWINRLAVDFIHNHDEDGEWFTFKPIHFDVIRFANGYGRNVPTMLVQCKGIMVSNGIEMWGGSLNEKYFVIQLGELLNSTPNPERSVASKVT